MQAICDALLARGVRVGDLRFVGSRRGQEAALLGAGPVTLTLLPGRGIKRSLSPSATLSNLGALVSMARAIVRAQILVARWRPSVVVSVGGYASFALSLAAVLWRRPLVLVELDASPGAAQRILTRFATKRCTAFGSEEPRSIFTGAPLREAITKLDRSPEARRRACEAQVPPIESSRTVLVVMTGSLGARRVNDAVSDLAANWTARHDLAIVHVSGRRDFDAVKNRAPELHGLDYRVVAFGDMVELWSLCDVAVCRSGATTVAELTALGIASVLVPLPGAPGDHQTKNAQILVERDAARLVPDAKCDATTLQNVLEDVMEPSTRRRMGAAARSLGQLDAAGAIATVVLDVRGRA
jgi:UDP-N-acetylglucosamine--N-acetylmuramyl-(pentapeptide) pyrophosphoryl-undecaprenol N-acetylglucosamine transferase